MFAKIFTQILDSSLAEDYQTRHVFEDLLKLCDLNGVVDMTHEAIARRTNVPLEIVKRGIAELENPDPRSRNPDHNGCRIIRLDAHRDWGWSIINYDIYRRIEKEEQRREKTRIRVHKLRERRRQGMLPGVTPDVTVGSAGNGMQREMQRETDKALKSQSQISEPLKEAAKRLQEDAAKEAKANAEENRLLVRCRELFGDESMKQFGGLWRKHIRSRPEKVERVLNAVESDLREGKDIKSPGGYAGELWKLFADH